MSPVPDPAELQEISEAATMIKVIKVKDTIVMIRSLHQLKGLGTIQLYLHPLYKQIAGLSIDEWGEVIDDFKGEIFIKKFAFQARVVAVVEDVTKQIKPKRWFNNFFG